MATSSLLIFALQKLPLFSEGDDLALSLGDALAVQGSVEPGDVIVVAQKVVSKVEGGVARETLALALAGDRR